nr:MAG TPA: hypothetical protein [Caudoviricetes sp.]
MTVFSLFQPVNDYIIAYNSTHHSYTVTGRLLWFISYPYNSIFKLLKKDCVSHCHLLD